MTTQHMHIEQKENILYVQFTRPEKKNALTPDMYDALIEAVNRADNDESIHVIYLTGSGDSFCAGNDLKTFLHDRENDAAQRFIRRFSVAETPIIAAVNGLAVGVGVTMLLHCDLVYAVPSAVFNFAFIDLGLVPEAASSYLMPQIVGQRRAAELLMLGGKFDAHTAKSIELINDILDADDFAQVTWEIAERLAAKPPEALRMTKHLLKRGNAETVAETIDYELSLFWERLQSDEVATIMQAILSRKPVS
ncbi:MAG: enoyl-CoA hydratase-related protein [Chloroflexota bacterium]